MRGGGVYMSDSDRGGVYMSDIDKGVYVSDSDRGVTFVFRKCVGVVSE